MRKKVEARGRLDARRPGIEVGLFTRLGRAAMMPEESVTTRNEC